MSRSKLTLSLLTAAALCLAQPVAPTLITKSIPAPDATYLQIDRPGYASTFLMGIAANGSIAGFSSRDAAPYSGPSQYLQATGFLLQHGKITDLAYPNPANPSQPLFTFPLKLRVNGVVAGWSAPDQQPSGGEVGWLWRKGKFEQIIYTGPDHPALDPAVNYWRVTDVMSVNGRGDMVGQIGWVNPADPSPGPSQWHGWLFRDGVFRLIDPPEAVLTYPSDINERGEIVGLYRTPTFRRGFLRSPDGSLRDIVATPSSGTVLLTFPQAINNSGDIVGFYATTLGVPRGFLLRRGVFMQIDVPGSSDTVVYDINESGVMVGTFKDASGVHGFIRLAGHGR